MRFREDLPQNCPPANAAEISGPLVMYRLTQEKEPTNEDFFSFRKLKPEAKYQELNECLASGLSVFSDPKLARKRAVRRMKGYRVCRVKLDIGSGMIMKTYGHGHHTWWPYHSFDILGCCETVADE